MARISFCNRNHFILILLCISAHSVLISVSGKSNFRFYEFHECFGILTFGLIFYSYSQAVECKEMSLRWYISSIKKYKMRYFRRFTWLQAHKNYINVYLANWKRTKCIKSLIFLLLIFALCVYFAHHRPYPIPCPYYIQL